MPEGQRQRLRRVNSPVCSQHLPRGELRFLGITQTPHNAGKSYAGANFDLAHPEMRTKIFSHPLYEFQPDGLL